MCQCLHQYVKSEFSIELIHWEPRSPFINVLDLGVWCYLQAHMEKKHCNTESLCQSVMKTWSEDALTATIGKVFERLHNVLCLMNDGYRSNDLVETKREVKNRDMKMDQNKNSDIFNINLDYSDDEEDECYLGLIQTNIFD